MIIHGSLIGVVEREESSRDVASVPWAVLDVGRGERESMDENERGARCDTQEAACCRQRRTMQTVQRTWPK
jgi:hypothetical protein